MYLIELSCQRFIGLFIVNEILLNSSSKSYSRPNLKKTTVKTLMIVSENLGLVVVTMRNKGISLRFNISENLLYKTAYIVHSHLVSRAISDGNNWHL